MVEVLLLESIDKISKYHVCTMYNNFTRKNQKVASWLHSAYKIEGSHAGQFGNYWSSVVVNNVYSDWLGCFCVVVYAFTFTVI